jgi:hypothetical protein
MTSADQSTTRSTAPAPKKDPKTGTWHFVFDSIHPNPDGFRRQEYRRGFAKQAQAAAESGLRSIRIGRPARDLSLHCPY